MIITLVLFLVMSNSSKRISLYAYISPELAGLPVFGPTYFFFFNLSVRKIPGVQT